MSEKKNRMMGPGSLTHTRGQEKKNPFELKVIYID